MWVAVSIAGLIVVLLYLLYMPVDLIVRFDARSGENFRVDVVWFHGLLTKKIAPSVRKAEAKREKTAARRRSIFKRPDIGTLFQVLRTRGIFRQVIRLLKDLFRQLKFRYLEAEIKFGLGNPAETGFCYALITSVMPSFTSSKIRRIEVRPDFGDGPVCEGFVQGALRLRPIKLIVPLERFIFSRPVMRLGTKLMLRRWKSKK